MYNSTNISISQERYDYLVSCAHTLHILDALSRSDRYCLEEIVTIIRETLRHDPDGDLPFVTVGEDGDPDALV